MVQTGVVLFINYQRSDLTLQAVAHIQRLYPQLHIVVVDNGSTPEAIELLEATLPKSVCLVKSLVNTGFSGGTNLGIQAAEAFNPDYVWILNNDAFPEAGALEAMTDMMLCQPPGLVGSVVHTNGKRPYMGGQINWWKGNTQAATETLDLDYVTAASLLIPWPVVQQLGPWDERYFLYVEDIEYGVRAKRAGLSIYTATNSRVHHLKGQTTGGSANPVNQYYAARNRLLFFSTYASPLQWLCVVLTYAIKLLFSGLKGLLNNQHALHHRIKWLAWLDFWVKRFGPCRHALNKAEY